MAFQFAATNLVVELGIVMAILLGWQFTLAEFVGGPLWSVVIGPIIAVVSFVCSIGTSCSRPCSGTAGSRSAA